MTDSLAPGAGRNRPRRPLTDMVFPQYDVPGAAWSSSTHSVAVALMGGMARPPRIHAPGLLYHLITRGNNGQVLFPAADDFQAFLRLLGEVRSRYACRYYAYCLMPNHVHVLAEVKEDPTATVMHALLTSYAKRFNRKYDRRGHVFEGRYKAILCDKDSYLLELTRYIHLNPVRAGLVPRPEEWPWSGHRNYLEATPAGLIDHGPVMGALQSPRRYAEFIREGCVADQGQGKSRPPGGARYTGLEGDGPGGGGLSAPEELRRRVSLDDLCERLARERQLDPVSLRQRGRRHEVVACRDGFIVRALTVEGYRAVEVARFLGCDLSNVTRAMRKYSVTHGARHQT